MELILLDPMEHHVLHQTHWFGFSTTTDVGSQYGTTFDGFGSFLPHQHIWFHLVEIREKETEAWVYHLVGIITLLRYYSLIYNQKEMVRFW